MMERLTREKRGKVCDGGRHPTKYTSDHTTQEVVARLAAYEDTGLTPEEIEEFDAGLLAAYKETGLAPEEIALYKEAEEISESMAPGRLIELAQAERDRRLVVLPDGDDTAALAATIDSTDMVRVWCGGDGDLLIGLLSMLAREVAQRAGIQYSDLLEAMSICPPVGTSSIIKTEEGKSNEKG